MKIAFTLCVAIVLGTNILIGEADIAPLSNTPKVAYMLLANELGAFYSIPPARIKHVLKHESGYSQDAVGDHGKAIGVAQFHKQTFIGNEQLYFTANNQHLNYDSGVDQIKLMTWMWKTYPKSTGQWTTYK